ncbi:hypothetical protein [Streptomyces sp. NBC_00435]|uniref:hypothetical protein n=1 Tax=Streptomyces sp. NBC_00435 TaxID=2903649 RepID=UPI002E1D4A68
MASAAATWLKSPIRYERLSSTTYPAWAIPEATRYGHDPAAGTGSSGSSVRQSRALVTLIWVSPASRSGIALATVFQTACSKPAVSTAATGSAAGG